MSEFENHSDQAEKLRTKMIDDYKEQNGDYPSRSEIHKNKEKKTKYKMKYPVISLLALFFFLLPILILSINLYYGGDKRSTTNNVDMIGNETVKIPTSRNSKDSTSLTNEKKSSENQTEITEPENEQQEEIEDSVIVVEEISNDTEGNKEQEQPLKEQESNVDANADEQQYSAIKSHKVAKGETLFNIAIKYYNSRSGEEIIRNYNGIEANDIYVGQTLKIPLD